MMYVGTAVALAGATLAYKIRPRPMDTPEARKQAYRTLPGVEVPSGMKIVREDFVTTKNVRLSYIEFYPTIPSKAVIYVCHGYADSTNWLWYGRCVRLAKEVSYGRHEIEI